VDSHKETPPFSLRPRSREHSPDEREMDGGWRRGVAEEDDARMTANCLDGSHDLGEGRQVKDIKNT
jgi:hypothetical protein